MTGLLTGVASGVFFFAPLDPSQLPHPGRPESSQKMAENYAGMTDIHVFSGLSSSFFKGLF